MCGYLKKFMDTHKYFVEAVGGQLIRRKGLNIQDYMYSIVQPQVPIDEIGIVLLARMYKMHVCIFLEGKYFTTNRDEALNKATIYLIYVGKNTFLDTRKGSIHWSIMEQPESSYDLCEHKKSVKKPVLEKPNPEPQCHHKTLNSLQAGLTDEKAKHAARREYQKLNFNRPTKCSQGPPIVKPKCGQLEVKHHGLLKHRKRDRKLKCPVCFSVFILIKDLNMHVCTKHRRFRYICEHCPRKFMNYASCYKHQKTHSRAPNVCRKCGKSFWFPMNLKIHERTHTGHGLTFPLLSHLAKPSHSEH